MDEMKKDMINEIMEKSIKEIADILDEYTNHDDDIKLFFRDILENKCNNCVLLEVYKNID